MMAVVVENCCFIVLINLMKTCVLLIVKVSDRQGLLDSILSLLKAVSNISGSSHSGMLTVTVLTHFLNIFNRSFQLLINLFLQHIQVN